MAETADIQTLEEMKRDAEDLAKVVGGAADLGTTGLVSTRLAGLVIPTLAKVVADGQATIDVDIAAAEAAAASAQAAAEASGDVEFFDEKADATAALGGLVENQVVEVASDESAGGLRTRYRVESGALVLKALVGGLDGLTRDLVGSVPVPAPVKSFRTAGYAAAGRGGDALYHVDDDGSVLPGDVVSSNARRFHLAPGDGPVDVRRFGGICDGVYRAANDTALTDALSYANTKGIRSVLIHGDFAWNPAAITWPVNNAIHAFGTLRPQTGIVMDGSRHLIGIGGPGAVQFQRGPAVQIVDPANGDPVIKLSGSANQTLRNITINGCKVGIAAGFDSGINALVRMENVSVLSNQANGVALDIDNVFWLWAINCGFLTTVDGLWSIRADNSLRVAGQVGLFYFRDLITSGRGVKMTSPVTAASGEIGNWHFDDWHHENLPVGDTVLTATGNVQSIEIDGYGNSDSLGAGYDFDVEGCLNFNLRSAQTEVVKFKSYPKNCNIQTDNVYGYTKTPWQVPAAQPDHNIVVRGDQSVRPVARGQAVTTCIGTPLTVATPSGAGITVTAGQRAPDGSLTAHLLAVPSGGALTQYDANLIAGTVVNLDAGDFIIFGAAYRSQDLSLDISGRADGSLMQVGLAGVHGLTFDTGSIIAGVHGRAFKWNYGGWVPLYGVYGITGTKTADPTVNAKVLFYNDRSLLIWKPWVRYIKAADGWDKGSLIRYLNTVGTVPAVANGVAATHSHVPLLTGSGVTGSRPSGTQPKGAQWFDTTLNKPIWADGAGGWKDATGAAV